MTPSYQKMRQLYKGGLMATGRTPEERFFGIVKQLQDRIDALEARPLQIPIVDEDSGDFAGNIWAFQDGRVRVRLADGTVREIITTASTGATTTVPRPVVPPQSRVQQKSWPALWSQAYRFDGSVTGGSAHKLYYGNDGNPVNGRQSSLIGFDYADITSTLSGSTVNKVELFLHNDWTYSPSGSVVFFGAHSNSTQPASFTGVVENLISSDQIGTAEEKYHPLATRFGQLFRDGIVKGIVLQAPNDSTAYSGYASGVGGGPPGPVLRINYTK